ncbi:MAG: hypothetical protein F4Z65_03470 [Acidobacteria bacterium]|nr:hypothetical protein [Acidobacteriota bacterium]MYA45335.1 hypothetical protein [Acidobacteriota bacterium]MYI39096.1 hypothetical protein [Acidobacteriota bacterium]
MAINGDDPKPVELKVHDLDWSEVQAAPIAPCNIFIVQGHQTGHVLNCGLADAPITSRESLVPNDVKIRLGARIHLTRQDLQSLIGILQQHLRMTSEKE